MRLLKIWFFSSIFVSRESFTYIHAMSHILSRDPCVNHSSRISILETWYKKYNAEALISNDALKCVEIFSCFLMPFKKNFEISTSLDVHFNSVTPCWLLNIHDHLCKLLLQDAMWESGHVLSTSHWGLGNVAITFSEGWVGISGSAPEWRILV